MTISRLRLLLVTPVFALSSCGSFSTHAKTTSTPTPGSLDPSIIVKILRAQADMIEKQNDPATKLGELNGIGKDLDAGLTQAKNDCKTKGFPVDAKGEGQLMMSGILLACVPKPTAPPAALPNPQPNPQPTSIPVPPAPVKK